MKLIIIFGNFGLDPDPDSNPGFESGSYTYFWSDPEPYLKKKFRLRRNTDRRHYISSFKGCGSDSFVHFYQFFNW
jgi:hypothetical protein